MQSLLINAGSIPLEFSPCDIYGIGVMYGRWLCDIYRIDAVWDSTSAPPSRAAIVVKGERRTESCSGLGERQT